MANKFTSRPTRRKKTETKKTEFSKRLLLQESALIWVITISFIVLAFLCVENSYFGELPWLTAMVGLPWTAYAVSQGFYYRKAMKENIKDGIRYESVMAELKSDIDREDKEFEAEFNSAWSGEEDCSGDSDAVG